MGVVVSVNVGRIKYVPGVEQPSAIDKQPVAGRVAVGPLGFAGDEQADKRDHGGVEQAVYAYGIEDLDRWAQVLGRPLRAGQFGENMSIRGIDTNESVIGEKWRVGTALLQVSCPRIPCRTFQGWLGEPQWVKRFTEQGRPGAMLRVIESGDIGADDAIVIEHRPDHGVTIDVVFRARTTDRDLVPRLLQAPELSRDNREFALRHGSAR